jgi:hypothetical protein
MSFVFVEQNPDVSVIWQTRLTTSTAIVRTVDLNGVDSVFFYDGIPFDTRDELIEAMCGALSDGGIKYSDNAINRIRSDQGARVMTWEQYLEEKGGNFTSLRMLSIYWTILPLIMQHCYWKIVRFKITIVI